MIQLKNNYSTYVEILFKFLIALDACEIELFVIRIKLP